MVATECPRCAQAILPGQNFCPACGASLNGAPRAKSSKRKRRASARRIQLLGHLVTSAISGATTAAVVMILTNNFAALRSPGPVSVALIAPHAFEDRTERGRVNATALVPLADSRFLVVDDLIDDAFFELTFTPDGEKSGPLVRRPIGGLVPGMVEDLEGATPVEHAGVRYIAAVSSLEGDAGENTGSGLVRVTIAPDGGLRGEVMPGFRDWLFANSKELAGRPDASALEVQGLVWDPGRRALLLGVRVPTGDAGPILVPVRVRDWGGAWEVSNLEALPAITLGLPAEDRPKGILAISRHPTRGDYLVVLANVAGKVRDASLYLWDGRDGGAIRRVSSMVFHPDMKPEGIAFGTVGGKPAAVLVDDNGGYYVLWQPDLDAFLG